MKLNVCATLVFWLALFAGTTQAQMATISSNGIRGSCAAGCRLDLIETNIRITRHEQLNPKTEINVILQQVLSTSRMVDNGDGTTQVVVTKTYHKISESGWELESIDESTYPTSKRLWGFAVANPDGDRRYGTFRIIAKMRTLTGTDPSGGDEYSNPVTFLYGSTITLRCSGCDGGGGGQPGGNPPGQ